MHSGFGFDSYRANIVASLYETQIRLPKLVFEDGHC